MSILRAGLLGRMTDLERRAAWGSLAASLLLTLVFAFSGLDLWVQALAYAPQVPGGPWIYGEEFPWRLLYDYGTWPAVAVSSASFLVFFLSYTAPACRPWRYQSLFLVLVLLLGPGLLVNVLGKGMMGRPRPWQVAEFGGLLTFVRPFEIGTPGVGRSFLSGHASMGFYFTAFFFLLKGRLRRLVLLAGLAFGLLIGAARILQGGHFLSDILLCGALSLALQACLAPVARLGSKH